MRIPIGAKLVLVAAGVGIAYRLYQLYEIGNRLTYSATGIKVKREGNTFSLVVTWNLSNPTNAKVNVKSIDGRLWIGSQQISSFAGPSADIIPGITRYDTTFLINNAGVISALVRTIAAGKWPVFTVNMRTGLGLFSVSEKYDIDSKQFADQIKNSLTSVA